MEVSEFFDNVEAHEELKGLGVDQSNPEKPGVLVEFMTNGMISRVAVALIEEFDWNLLEEVLVGKREPHSLQHMSRVVGYFSRIENWNKSKLGELKDRQKGDYAIVG